MKAANHADLLIIGGGPGGYTAAFRAADLGRSVVLIDARDRLGGVCLNVGCIPSKALLHAAKVMTDADDFAAHGIRFNKPAVDLDVLRSWKESVVTRLTGGLHDLARTRKVSVVRGVAQFATPSTVTVQSVDGTRTFSFDQAIIAAGSEPVRLPFVSHDDPRILDSSGALALKMIPDQLLILGGGVIGLEMATIYAALGSRVTVAEWMDQIIPGADRDLVAPLQKRMSRNGVSFHLQTKLTGLDPQQHALVAHLESPAGARHEEFDCALLAVGRRPNGHQLKVEAAGLALAADGSIPVDAQMRTAMPHIFAIGDIVGQPMLAHKATHQAKVASEAASSHKVAMQARVIPAVAYTGPEVAWAGLTELEATRLEIPTAKAIFPWAASGRSLALGRDEGFTKLLFDPTTRRLLGAGIVGSGAGELIAEATLAIEMGADAEDISLTIHPHPTLSETLGLTAEVFAGTITDLPQPKKRSAAASTSPRIVENA